MNDKSTVVSRRKFIVSITKAAALSIVGITALPAIATAVMLLTAINCTYVKG